jgi:hypothetical protein
MMRKDPFMQDKDYKSLKSLQETGEKMKRLGG